MLQLKKRQAKLNLKAYETAAYERGFSPPAGVDEAGRGPLAGPVVAGACLLPRGLQLEGVNDSKKLTPPQRDRLYDQLMRDARITCAVGIVDSQTIDQINILQATMEAMRRAIAGLALLPDLLLVDGLHLNHQIPCQKIIKGDTLSQSIMAGAILAKVTRDRIMVELDRQFPAYGFAKHKGYGTRHHLEALALHGPCPQHRLSFAPCHS